MFGTAAPARDGYEEVAGSEFILNKGILLFAFHEDWLV